MAFAQIVKLFETIQPIKRRHPMVVTCLKHLHTLNDDVKKNAEVECFKQFLLLNNRIAEREFDESKYIGTKKVIVYFENISHLAADALNTFWETIQELDKLIFPNGRPTPDEAAAAAAPSDDAATRAMAIIGENPVFSEIVDQVKTILGNTDPKNIDTSNFSSILGSGDFKKLVKKIKSGMTSGKFSMDDILKTINAVTETVSPDLDQNTRDTFQAATSMISAAQRGEEPDISKIQGLIQNLNLC